MKTKIANMWGLGKQKGVMTVSEAKMSFAMSLLVQEDEPIFFFLMTAKNVLLCCTVGRATLAIIALAV
jgi:hypothetical protein